MQIAADNANTEREMLGLLKENFRLAAEVSDKLASGKRGRTYVELRDLLRTLEDLCRKVAHNRGDTRWLPIGLKIAEAQKRSREWLVAREPAWRFTKLAELMRLGLAKAATDLETKRTGRRGAILPVVLEGPHRDTRPVQVPSGFKTHKSGLIVPSSTRG